ncbi:MAG: flagellar hook-length control protein FliK [Treponemataceae bacterium]
MISSSTQAFQAEASQNDPLGLPRVSKKKKAASSASLFSSLVEKAKGIKEGLTRASAAPAIAKTESELHVASRIEDEKKKTNGNIKTLIVSEREKRADFLRSSVQKVKTDSSTAIGTPHAAPVALKSVPLKDVNDEDRDVGQSDSIRSQKNKTVELTKKDRSREIPDGASDSFSTASISVSASLVTQQKVLRKEDASAKPEEKTDALEGKKKDKRKDRLEIEVIDQRKGEASGGVLNGTVKGSSEAGTGDSSSKASSDLVLSLREGSGGTADGNEGSTSGSKTNFADALSRELRASYNGEIVKHASVVLKDGGEGLIRLALRPEALGSVKIKLELTDNKIAGRILVETEEALKAFSKELRSLEQAFLDGGFDGASIELALSSGDTGAGSGRKEETNAPRPFFSDRLIASEYDSSVPSAESASRRSFGGREDAVIDMLA